MNMYDAAKIYALPNNYRPPLHVFPLIPRAKEPLQKGGFYNASNNPAVVQEMWRRCPDANIGCRLINMVVLDVDAHDPNKDGADTLRELEREYGELPETWICLTPTGGAHYYFSTDDQRLTKAENIADGLDYRGNLAYVLLPPSVHPCGGIYQWDAGHTPNETPLAPLPEWLHDLMLKATAKQSSGTGSKEVPDEIPDGQRNDTLFRIASSLRSKGLTIEEMLPSMLEINKRCANPLDVRDIKTICRSTGRYERGTSDSKRSSTNSKVKPKDFSDAGAAKVFADNVKGSLLWCDSLGWLVWDGRRWDTNEHAATALAMEYAQNLLDDALDEYKRGMRTDAQTGTVMISDEAAQYLKFAQKTRNAVSIQHFMTLAKAFLHIKADQLDADPYMLNCASGIIDLRSGKILPHDPKALCTKIASASPSSTGAEMWEDFLKLITNNDTALAAYHQEADGMCLIGKIFHEGIRIDIGAGQNGKSTKNNAISHVLGDYAGSIDSTILTTEKQNRGAALATLRGKRFVTCGELEEGQRLSVQTLKRLASTDKLTIEEKYRQPETITPSHHIILFSNFLPRVGSTDNGTWRRLTVVPFNAIMPSGCADIPNYAEKLATEAGGAILQWLIDGAKRFYQNGCHLNPPEVVRQATEAYRVQEDWLQSFINERCIRDPRGKTRVGELYAEYKAFAASTGDYCRRGNDFTKAMLSAGYNQISEHGGKKSWIGLRIDYAQDYGEPPQASCY